ncbi:hypothetical protein BU23DRAFT_549999 [Bimuria novae-zelandiae CBS 107.79]|uniref:Uncharacterized protein n=1 Tax=Bimuria novae-zelandiae CBS 107.79 TaxID=1447943 RepID=A0A6A5VPV6_9PLEO|nr:hypothetical protein BU23DRAFT_549999 [Bimuria novae-zelandiae CBS 107.79]
MRTRRSIEPPLSPKPISASYDFDSRRTHEPPAMSYPVQVETRNTDDTVSLTSLESGADEFDRRMIQTARDERGVNDARTPRIQAFSKARIHPRVGVTLENLERHNAKTNAAPGPNAHVKFNSPPSSSGSTRSDLALNVPSGWGRKARVKRDWMRTITAEDREHTADRTTPDPDETPRRDADEPRQSIEDSPLSHKSSLHGTPASQRRLSIDDWSFDMNEASLIASTPYRPRNTVLDDIRQREIESLKEQGVATSQLDRIRERSPEEMRRSRPASTKSANEQTTGTAPEPESPTQDLSNLRLHKRTNSWQAMGKAPAVMAQGTENSPIVMYKKSSETIGVVDSRLLANQATPARRPPNRRDDSHDLLRRLARASSTPSPGRIETSRPQTAPTKQIGSSSQTAVTETSHPVPSTRETSGAIGANEIAADRRNTGEEQHQPDQKSSNVQTPNDIEATPKPAERSMLNPKTPRVMGAWVDTIIETPGPSNLQRPSETSQSSTSPRKRSPRKQLAQESQLAQQEKEQEQVPPKVSKLDLPRSVLDAIVEEARAGGHRRPTDYGDSTINSLEELIAPMAEASESGDPDEDTIGVDVPTAAPRNEAERRRQEELSHIRQMDQKLRSTRTSLRDTSRGIRRVEEQMERDLSHDATDVAERSPDSARIVYRDYKCPCVEDGHAQSSLTNSLKRLFYDARLKPTRRGWGLTWLSIALLTLLTWFVLENICCEIWGHHTYASSYTGYGVVWGAPEYPYVLPTMTYRAFVRPWWRPLYALLSWMWRVSGGGSEDAAPMTARTTATRIAERILLRGQAGAEFEEEASVLGMAGDEVLR